MTYAERYLRDEEALTRFRLDQAARVGAALRGELGLDAQILAMSEYYKELRSRGEHDAAAAVKAEAKRLRGLS